MIQIWTLREEESTEIGSQTFYKGRKRRTSRPDDGGAKISSQTIQIKTETNENVKIKYNTPNFEQRRNTDPSRKREESVKR